MLTGVPRDIDKRSEERIEVSFLNGKFEKDIVIDAGKYVNIPIIVRLTDKRLEPQTRIQPGTYTGVINVIGDLMGETKVPFEVKVPKIPGIKRLMRILSFIIFIPFIFLVFLFLRLFYLKRRLLFEGEFELSRAFNMGDSKIEKKGKGYFINPGISRVELNGAEINEETELKENDKVKISIKGKEIAYKVNSLIDEVIDVENEDSPYGSLTGYILTKIIPLIILLGILVWVLQWTIIHF